MKITEMLVWDGFWSVRAVGAKVLGSWMSRVTSVEFGSCAFKSRGFVLVGGVRQNIRLNRICYRNSSFRETAWVGGLLSIEGMSINSIVCIGEIFQMSRLQAVDRNSFLTPDEINDGGFRSPWNYFVRPRVGCCKYLLTPSFCRKMSLQLSRSFDSYTVVQFWVCGGIGRRFVIVARTWCMYVIWSGAGTSGPDSKKLQGSRSMVEAICRNHRGDYIWTR